MNDLPSHELLSARDAKPTGWILLVHGILGRGLNWRGFARRLVRELPEWGAVLVDLRAHGDSQHLSPPDTVPAAAADLARLTDTLSTSAPIRAALGHSFGGKVVLHLAREHPLEQIFVVDSMPGARPHRQGSEGTARVVEMLTHLPARFADRRAFERYVTELGFAPALASWLGQNLRALDGPSASGYEFDLDVDRIRSLLDDFFSRDDWALLDPPGGSAHLVIGGRSSVYSESDRARALDLAAKHERVHVGVLEEADHWVHIDDPNGLHALVAGGLA